MQEKEARKTEWEVGGKQISQWVEGENWAEKQRVHLCLL